MISIIICSRTAHISEELATNIAETIGCEYELVVIDNLKNQHSIFSAYNEGVRRSKGDILCFMHDDIMYNSIGWGKQVEIRFSQEKNLGCLGVLGAYYLTKNQGYWDMMQPYLTGRVMVGENYEVNWNKYQNYGDEVVVVDGLWFCILKDNFSKISFDETFPGFHFYDMDICMQLLSIGLKNEILRDIEICHNCCIEYTSAFLHNMRLFYNKWSKDLPCKVENIETDDLICKVIDDHVSRMCDIYQKYGRKSVNYESVLNCWAFRLGTFLLQPIYLIKKIFKK